MGSRILLGCCIWWYASLALAQYALESTDVADAADVLILPERTLPNPFDIRFHTSYDLLIDQGVLEREWINLPNRLNTTCSRSNRSACSPVAELNYKRIQQRQIFRLDIGLYHDLAVTISLPVVLRDETQFGYPSGIDSSTSSVDPGNNSTLFPANLRLLARGVGHLGLGLRWGWLNQQKSPGKPSWVIYMNWHNPVTSVTNDLSNYGSPDKPAPVGDGLHWLQIGTALSRRMGIFGEHAGQSTVETWGLLEPYFRLESWLPLTDSKQTRAAQVAQSKPFYPGPSLRIEGSSGLAIVPWEKIEGNQRLVLDIGTTLRLTNAGRDPGLLGMALQRMLYHESFVTGLLHLAMTIQPISWLRLQFAGQIGYTTTHWLTNEVFGDDQNGDGQIRQPAEDTNASKDAINPYYCGNTPGDICQRTGQNIDQIGYRFRDNQHITYGGSLLLTTLF